MLKPKNSKIRKFKEWLSVHGAQVMPSLSEYEIIRFKSARGISLICMNKFDIITEMTNEAKKTWTAFCNNSSWSGGLKTKRGIYDKQSRIRLVNELFKRDGNTCAYCGRLLNMRNVTIEHVIPVSRGGEDSIENKVLSCTTCNFTVGSMNIRQKMEFLANARYMHHDNIKFIEICRKLV